MTDQDILIELNALQKELCTRANDFCNPSSASEPALWFFRAFQGVSLSQWESLSGKMDLKQWLTLPLDGDAYPHLKRVQDSLEHLAYQTDHDPLTSLANRRAFDRTLDIEIERARRAKSSVSLCILDLDNFKIINDTYGHPTGDEVLKIFSKMIQESTRRYDLAARLGGEEFALILSGTGQIKARRVIERLQEQLRNHTFTALDGRTFPVTCSAGLTCYKGTVDMSVKQLVTLADTALYKAKELGKDRLESSPIPDIDLVPKDTLVQANEKQFLFGK